MHIVEFRNRFFALHNLIENYKKIEKIDLPIVYDGRSTL